MEKTVNVEVKSSFQTSSKIREINVRYPKGYRSTKKDKSSWNYWNGNKAKSSHNTFPTNLS